MKRTKIYSLVLLLLLGVEGNALTLDEALKKAKKNSTYIKSSLKTLESLNYDIKEKERANYGRFDLQASYTHYDNERTLSVLTPSQMSSGKPIVTSQDILSVGVSYTLNLFNGFKDVKAIEIASLQKEIANNYHKLTLKEIAYNVKSLYLSILALESQQKAQTADIEALESLHSKIALKVKLGSIAKIDELKSLADLVSAKTKLSSIKTNITIAKESLATLMMQDSVDNLEDISIAVDEMGLKSLQSYEDDIALNDKVVLASLGVKKAQKNSALVDGSYYPKVDFSAYYGQNSDIVEFESEDMWQAGVTLKWNIYDFGRKDALAQKADIALYKTQLEKQKVQREIKKEIVEAVARVKESIESYKNAKIQLELLAQTQKIEEIRYENGASNINDLLYTKSRYSLAKSMLIGSKYSYKKALYFLEYIVQKGE